jgi:flavin reductase (DIM6/NTAB) family NADH-FMN oxidoreductase RutF
MLLVCVSHDSTTLPALVRRRRFVVNFLAGDRVSLARRFASDLDDKFAEVEWQPTADHDLPILIDDAVAYAECRTVEEIEAGDHVIVIGLIEDGDQMPDRSALVFRGGVFKNWHEHADPDTSASASRGQ